MRCALHALIFMFLYYRGTVSATRASTWDSCGCYWGEWESWSQCTAYCGGGTRRRSRMVWHHDIPECEGFKACASPGSGHAYEDCNEICYNGGTYRIFGYCSCPQGKKGDCCEQTVTCGTPSAISHGTVVGAGFTYGHTITYTCEPNYNFTHPTAATRRCSGSINGYWTGTLPQCLYATSCNSNPCKHGECHNLLGDYRCICESGWTGKNCETDIQAPIVTNCPSDIEVFVSATTSNQTWEPPQIEDPHGFDIRITTNYENPNFEFPWGVFTVQYNALKPSNGLSAECVFSISVKPHPCRKLTPALHGILACNGWNTDFTRICKYYCHHGYVIPPGYKPDELYICGASGHWFPQPASLPECIRSDIIPGEAGRTFGSCTHPEERKRIADAYIEDLVNEKSPFSSVCTSYTDLCTQANVEVLC